jgi:hypothetical protein
MEKLFLSSLPEDGPVGLKQVASNRTYFNDILTDILVS